MLAHLKAAEADAEPGSVCRGIKREGQGLCIICFGDYRIRGVSMFVNPNCSGVFSWEHLSHGRFGGLRDRQPWGSPELSLAIPWVHPLGAPLQMGGKGAGKDGWHYPQETALFELHKRMRLSGVWLSWSWASKCLIELPLTPHPPETCPSPAPPETMPWEVSIDLQVQNQGLEKWKKNMTWEEDEIISSGFVFLGQGSTSVEML